MYIISLEINRKGNLGNSFENSDKFEHYLLDNKIKSNCYYVNNNNKICKLISDGVCEQQHIWVPTFD